MAESGLAVTSASSLRSLWRGSSCHPVLCAVFLHCWLLTFFTWCCMRIVISLSIKVM